MEGLSLSGIPWPSIGGIGNGGAGCVKGRMPALGRSSISTSAASWSSSFTDPLGSLWRNGKENEGVVVVEDKIEKQEEEEEIDKNGSWVLKIMQVRSLWKGEDTSKSEEEVGKEEEEEEEEEDNGSRGGFSCSEGCSVEEEDDVKFDRDSFSRLLKRVSLADAKLYARISHLGNLSYSIPKMKSGNLLKKRGLRFVTSSLEKKALASSADKDNSDQTQETKTKVEEMVQQVNEQKTNRSSISASTAYSIVASAASYLQFHTRSITSLNSSKSGTEGSSLEKSSEIEEKVEVTSSELASFEVTTNLVTAVVASKEEKKQAVAKELNSTSTSPCEWYICDDDHSRTRFFVIQGSESLASWQANLLFEPIQFEGLDVAVHRGVYEAAKRIYEQMLPEVHAHLKAHGKSATFRFTGHSLGGSLSLLVDLMLLIRGEVPPSALLPVIMFGAPSIMCGGDQLLRRLGLPRSHVQAITMHRDIVPRAFSCNYPDHVVELLKAVNGNFRNHPCLQNQKLLYAPMGDILILQPDEKFSPHHDLLPSGSGLYLLSCPLSDSTDPEKQLQAARAAFFNSPHPLEILSDRSAYGSEGTIYRDHDMQFYLKTLLNVIRRELNQIRKTNKKQQRSQVWWPSIVSQPIQTGTAVGEQDGTQSLPSPFRLFHSGTESLKHFSGLVASQHTHLLVLLLFPARLLVFDTFSITRFL